MRQFGVLGNTRDEVGMSRLGRGGRMRIRGRRDRGRARPTIEFLEGRLTPAISTWTGAISGSWADAGNWDVAPSNGDDLVFPSGAGHLTDSTNDLTAADTFASVTISGSGYTITGAAITVTGAIDASQSSGLSSLNLPITLTAATPTVTVDTAGAILSLGGVVDGSGGLTKAGAGELELTANNTYTGTTAVSGGMLVVDGLQGQSAVTLAAGTTLSGTGAVGGVTSTGGILSPGQDAAGLLIVSGNVALDSATTYDVTLNGVTAGVNYNQLSVAGTVNLGGAILSATLGFTPTSNQQFTLINNTGNAAVTGTFNNLAEGATLVLSGQTFKISYVGGTGNDVVLTQLVNTTTSLNAAPTSAVVGQSVTLTATVAATGGSVTPGGTVQFFAGSTSLGTATLNNGTASINTGAIPLGSTNAITVQYLGSAAFAASTSAATNVAVAQASTATAVTANPNPAGQNATVTLTATVTAASPGTGTPTGTVEFFAGSTSLGTQPVNGSGVATLTTTFASLGPNSITAIYAGDANYTTSTSPAVTLSILDSSTTSLVALPASSVFGQPVTLTATVAAGTGTGTPTGNVQFFAGSTSLGTATLSGGTAALSTSAIPVGASNSITAQYLGDSTFATSTSAATTYAVAQASTSTSLAAAPTSSTFGQTVTLTATVAAVSPGSGTPTGSVQFFAGSTSLGTGSLNGSGVATLSTSAIPVGSANSITAQYLGVANFAGSTSAATTFAVAQASTSTTVTATPNPAGVNATVTLAATVTAVSPGGGTAAGTVEFFAGSTSLGTATLNGSGVATRTTTFASLGTNSITAVYQGNANYTTSTSPAVTLTVLEASTTSLVAVPTSSVFGQPVTLTATVAAGTGTGTPTGTVQFFAGSTSLGTATLTGGVATLSTSAIPVGSANSITAQYQGDSSFAGSTSAATTFVVAQASSTTTVVAAPTSSVFGQPVTLTATVAAVSPGSGTPVGTVQFFVGATSLGTGTLNSSGVATLSTAAIPVGSANSITARYLGGANFTASTSAATTFVVNQAGTTTTVVAAPTSSVLGQSVTLTATVAAASPGAGTPTGTVQFFAGSTLLGSAALNGSRVATLATTAIPAGTNSITAVYQGDANFSTSTSTPITVPVGRVATTTTVTASPNPATPGAVITLTARVAAPSASSGQGIPAGTVGFYLGDTLLGTAALDGNGVATLVAGALPIGNNPITAIYGGNATFATSTSAVTAASVGSENQIFINQVYLDVMGRPADAKGLAYWTRQLDGGGSRRKVITGIVRSPEAIHRSVQDIFESLLGRSATRREVNAALSMNNPTVLNITTAVLGSREFYRFQGGGTIDGYLLALEDIVLGRSLPTGAARFFTGELRKGVPTIRVAQQLLSSRIGVEAIVDTLYGRYLGRFADNTGLYFYTALVHAGFTPGQVTVNILTSPEYYDLALDSLGTADQFSLDF